MIAAGQGIGAGTVLWLVVAGVLVGCAPPDDSLRLPRIAADRDRARLAVVVHRGFSRRAAPTGSARLPVSVLIDMTPSMAAASGAGVGRFVAAREAAVRFIEALPADVAVDVHAVGTEGARNCNEGLRTRSSEPGRPRGELLADLSNLEPAGEASLAAGLVSLQQQLAAADALAGARVVVYSDLGEQCGGDLCDALIGAASGGARIDLVIFGDAPALACADDPPLAAVGSAAEPEPIAFRVSPTGSRGRVVNGVGDGRAIAVPPGPVQIAVELESLLHFDAVPLLPGKSARLTVVDFPALDPPVREWFWEFDVDAVAKERKAMADGS